MIILVGWFIVFSSFVIYLGRTVPPMLQSRSNVEDNIAELALYVSLLVGLVGGIYLWIQNVSKKIKSNETAYKYSGSSGAQKMVAVLSNSYAREAVWRNWKIWMGLAPMPLKIGEKAPECDLIGVDGRSKYKLLRDYANKTDIPLILNIGSYN